MYLRLRTKRRYLLGHCNLRQCDFLHNILQICVKISTAVMEESVGWASWQNVQGFGEPPTVKSQILNLIRSIRTVARIPLIFLNIVTIIVNNWCLGERND
ncbi:immediate early response 3-interacting protein 1-like isoform X2 [Bombus affinis]|uniref:immediate early response 3-interacting protein 1-like isoform X1 n=1 Tax=Bombus affinis TaxID=309941 RepID=UPI0021B77256|nr:immediate early response 3-interacting protein 1-like isoform X1 [Bombus affinis]XP_050599423.1 immediate early response 3-interacting protein 1-like isoform X2 [Bombus affinis]